MWYVTPGSKIINLDHVVTIQKGERDSSTIEGRKYYELRFEFGGGEHVVTSYHGHQAEQKRDNAYARILRNLEAVA